MLDINIVIRFPKKMAVWGCILFDNITPTTLPAIFLFYYFVRNTTYISTEVNILWNVPVLWNSGPQLRPYLSPSSPPLFAPGNPLGPRDCAWKAPEQGAASIPTPSLPHTPTSDVWASVGGIISGITTIQHNYQQYISVNWLQRADLISLAVAYEWKLRIDGYHQLPPGYFSSVCLCVFPYLWFVYSHLSSQKFSKGCL